MRMNCPNTQAGNIGHFRSDVIAAHFVCAQNPSQI